MESARKALMSHRIKSCPLASLIRLPPQDQIPLLQLVLSLVREALPLRLVDVAFAVAAGSSGAQPRAQRGIRGLATRLVAHGFSWPHSHIANRMGRPVAFNAVDIFV